MPTRPPTQPETWYTLEQTAALCERSIPTIRNLLSRYKLPTQRLWIVRHRIRRRRIRLSPPVVAYLQQITLNGVNPKTLQRPLR